VQAARRAEGGQEDDKGGPVQAGGGGDQLWGGADGQHGGGRDRGRTGCGSRAIYDEGEVRGDRGSPVRIGNHILQLCIHGLDMGFGGLGIN
jgi:hypothetical protein